MGLWGSCPHELLPFWKQWWFSGGRRKAFTGYCTKHSKWMISFNLPNNHMKYVLLPLILQFKKSEKWRVEVKDLPKISELAVLEGPVPVQYQSRARACNSFQHCLPRQKLTPGLIPWSLSRRGKEKYRLFTADTSSDSDSKYLPQQLYWDKIH